MISEPDYEADNFDVKPLTKICKRTGEAFFRPDEVTNDIIRFLKLLNENAHIELSSFKCETLVYMYREKFYDDEEMTGKIWEILSEKVLKVLTAKKEFFEEDADFDDFFGDIQLKLIKRISDLKSNSADFAQVNFYEYVKSLMLNEMRLQQKHYNRFVPMETTNDDGEIIPFELPDNAISPEKELVLKRAVAALPSSIKEVFVLYHFDGWKIHSNDPEEITISFLYGKSEKTIRNWIRQAEETVRDFLGETK